MALAGCGGGESADDEANVAETWTEFADAALAQDGEAACARLSTEAADGGLAREIGLPPAEGCEEQFVATAAIVQLDVSQALENVTVDGDSATAEAGAVNPTFVEEDGEWKVESLDGGG